MAQARPLRQSMRNRFKEARMNKGNKRVLVIDDNPDMRRTMQVLLESEGFAVSVAADGEEALRIQKSSPAQVVVTDIFMPGKEGIETIYELRKQFPQTKVIVMSGGLRAKGVDYFEVARELGAVKTLKKPFAPAELIEALRELTSSD
jgi:DNA-binding response OmpR family regulator